MWRSVFLHEFIDHRIGNFQALPGRPTPPSFLLQASDALLPGTNAVAISPGAGFEHVLDSALHSIVGVSARVRMIYPLNPQPRMFSVVRLGGAAELLFWPVSDPLPDGSGTVALARVWVGTGFRNLGNVVLPATRFVEFRFDWHASGQARLLADGRLVAYHNAVAPGALLSFDRVAFGIGNVTPASPQPLYHVARVFVRALARPDPLAHLSKLLPVAAARPTSTAAGSGSSAASCRSWTSSGRSWAGRIRACRSPGPSRPGRPPGRSGQRRSRRTRWPPRRPRRW